MISIATTLRSGLIGGAAAMAFFATVGISAPVAGDIQVFKAAHIHTGDGRVIEDGVLIVEDQRIKAVGKGLEIPAGAVIIEHDGALSAGMIALRDASGTARTIAGPQRAVFRGGIISFGPSTQAANENVDDTRTLMPEARVAHAFHPQHGDFERLLAEGITTTVLSPGQASVVGGVSAAVKTSGGSIVRRDAQLNVSMSTSALRRNRYPTSYASMVAELDTLFQGGQGMFGEAKAKRVPVAISVNSRSEIMRALAFSKRHGLQASLVGAPRAGELLEAVKASGLSVILAPLGLGADLRYLRSAVALAEEGVPIGFAVDSPGQHASGLRYSAAACMAQGLSAERAWNALTADAARILGVDKRVGQLAPGLDADLVLWSGPPTELGSSVQAVYIDGALAYGGAQ